MQGIDLNLIDLIDDSDGGIRENKRFYASSRHKLAKAQRKLSRRQNTPGRRDVSYKVL